MLRLNPTQIRLDAKDFKWHRESHYRRQAQREELGYATHNELIDRTSRLSLDDLSKRRADAATENDTNDEQPLVSDEPVPKGSRAYWDHVLADAGTPTRTQVISRNAEVVEPSDEWVDSNHSSRASVSGSGSEEHDDVYNGLSVGRNSTVVKRKDLKKHYDISLDSVHSHAGRIHETTIQADSQSNMQSPLRRRVHALLGRQNFHVDGSSDMRQLTPSNSRDHVNDGIGDGLYGSQEDRRTISSNWMAYDADGPMHRSSIEAVPALSSRGDSQSPLAPLLRHNPSLEYQDTGSSQESSPLMPEHVGHAFAPTGLLSEPPRRRHREYRRRSPSHSAQISDDIRPPSLPQYDGLGASPASPTDLLSPFRAPQSRDHGHSPGVESTSRDQAALPRFPFSPLRSSPATSMHSGTPPQLPWMQRPYLQASYQSLRSGSSTSMYNHFAPSGVTINTMQSASSMSNTPLNSPSQIIGTRYPSMNIPPPFSSTPRNVSFQPALPTATPALRPSGVAYMQNPVPVGNRQDVTQDPHTPPHQRQASGNPFDQPSTSPSPFHWQLNNNGLRSQAAMAHNASPHLTSRTHTSLSPLAAPFTPSRQPSLLSLDASRITSPAPMSAINQTAPPRTPSFRVYDDAVSAATQPQTPDDLPRRNGYALRNPMTAPARLRATITVSRRDDGESNGGAASGGGVHGESGIISPTRRAARRSEEMETENEGRITLGERIMRRRRDRAMGLGAEERARTRGGL